MKDYNKIMFETLEQYFNYVKKNIDSPKNEEDLKDVLRSMILILERWLDEQ